MWIFMGIKEHIYANILTRLQNVLPRQGDVTVRWISLTWKLHTGGADNSLARPISRYILFDG